MNSNYLKTAKRIKFLKPNMHSSSLIKVSLLSLILCFSFISSNAFAVSEPIPYTAEYTGVFKGMKLTLKRELKKLGNNHYSITNSAKNSFAKLFETSDFHLFSDNRIQPIRYQYKTKYGPIKKHEDVRFDWAKKTAKDIKSDKPSVALNQFMADRISYQVFLRQLIKSGAKEKITIDLYNKGNKGSYTFQILKEEAVSTPAGRFKAVPVKKIYTKSSKSQTIWLAKDYDYVLLKLHQKDKKGTYEINLSKLTMKK